MHAMLLLQISILEAHMSKHDRLGDAYTDLGYQYYWTMLLTSAYKQFFPGRKGENSCITKEECHEFQNMHTNYS